ncbi:hypothetical protein [Mucilaginibacter lacusdianchii]|uniref:hypothetical protein n=1 Tax=Mucilaginibacter lacusdianchii TaxID=2684211 RepID=UPI0018EF2CC4|nr:hypothetical protein [Mucilaginibacter sp. JXJ CY 39]
MTRSNLYITLTGGEFLKCVADSSSAPEQGYIVEELILPLLALRDPDEELELLREHCTMDEQRSNADYRWEIDLAARIIRFYEESYHEAKDTFKKGLDLTGRYLSYLKKIETDTDKFTKRQFKYLSNKELVGRANGLPDLKWDDEAHELRRRSLVANGGFIYRMKGSHLVIIKDE